MVDLKLIAAWHFPRVIQTQSTASGLDRISMLVVPHRQRGCQSWVARIFAWELLSERRGRCHCLRHHQMDLSISWEHHVSFFLVGPPTFATDPLHANKYTGNCGTVILYNIGLKTWDHSLFLAQRNLFPNSKIRPFGPSSPISRPSSTCPQCHILNHFETWTTVPVACESKTLGWWDHKDLFWSRATHLGFTIVTDMEKMTHILNWIE